MFWEGLPHWCLYPAIQVWWGDGCWRRCVGGSNVVGLGFFCGLTRREDIDGGGRRAWVKRRRLSPLRSRWGLPTTRPRGTVTPPQKKREQNLDSSVCLLSPCFLGLDTFRRGFLWDSSLAFSMSLPLSFYSCRVGLHLMPSRGVMPSSAGRETSSRLSSTTRATVFVPKAGRWHSSHWHVD